MNRWTRSPRIPARLSRWINFVHTGLQHWAHRAQQLHGTCLALSRGRRRRPVLLGLEALEARELLDANSTLVGDLAHLRNEVATSAVALINAVQPSPTNSPTPASVASAWNKAWTTLTTDGEQMRQAFVQFEDAALTAVQEELDTLLNDLGIRLPGQTSPVSPPPASPPQDASPPPVAPPTTGSGTTPGQISPSLAPASDSSASGVLGLSSSLGATLSATMRGNIGGGIFTFTGTLTIASGSNGKFNSGDAVTGSISGFSGDTLSGTDNFNLNDNNSGGSVNGSASGSYIGNTWNASISTSGNPKWQGGFQLNVLGGGGGGGGGSSLPPVTEPPPWSNDG